MKRRGFLGAGLGVLVAYPLLLALPLSCSGTTGSKRFAFEARIGGAFPEEGVPASFVNERGWSITLDRADMTVGPVYLNVISPLSYGPTGFFSSFIRSAHALGQDHLEPGRVVGEVLARATFDALSPKLVPFPALGTIMEEEIRTADLWFYPEPGISPDTTNISSVALDIAGEASSGNTTVRFRGSLVLDDAWLPTAPAGSVRSESIANIRRARGIPSGFVPTEGGGLEIRVDVRSLLRGADFANLADNPSDPDGTKVLVQSKTGDVTTDQVMENLYQGLHASTGTYAIAWVPRP